VTTIYSKGRRKDTIRYIEKWFYEAEIPFNTATLPLLQSVLIAIKRFGEMLEALSPYEFRETFLEREVGETQESLKPFKKSCIVSGYTLMTEAWSKSNERIKA